MLLNNYNHDLINYHLFMINISSCRLINESVKNMITDMLITMFYNSKDFE